MRFTVEKARVQLQGDSSLSKAQVFVRAMRRVLSRESFRILGKLLLWGSTEMTNFMKTILVLQ